jgi:hypothetical protein
MIHCSDELSVTERCFSGLNSNAFGGAIDDSTYPSSARSASLHRSPLGRCRRTCAGSNHVHDCRNRLRNQFNSGVVGSLGTADGVGDELVLRSDRGQHAAAVPGPLDQRVGTGDGVIREGCVVHGRGEPGELPQAEGERERTGHLVDHRGTVLGARAEDEINRLDEIGHELARGEAARFALQAPGLQLLAHVRVDGCADNGLHTGTGDHERRGRAAAEPALEQVPGEDLRDGRAADVASADEEDAEPRLRPPVPAHLIILTRAAQR